MSNEFQVGQKAMIRTDLDIHKDAKSPGLMQDMIEMGGQVYTIGEIFEDGIIEFLETQGNDDDLFYDDDLDWSWHPDWLVPYNPLEEEAQEL